MLSRLRTASLLVAVTAGCVGKADVGTAPFTGDYDEGKADSARYPRFMGRLHVGEPATGQLDRYHGWLSYEIELTASPSPGDVTDVTVTSPSGLDTILYVYGPRRASGYYPSRAMAFNDDRVPGEDTSSNIGLVVPTDGLYRVVVSTYDNWDSYPTNVSYGSYQVSVKCPRGGDACGPAVRWEGDACSADDQCVGGTHCEGEVVCPPLTECFYARDGECAADYDFLTFVPRQCGANPWQQDPHPGDGVSVGYTDPELEAIDGYFESAGIDLIALGLLDGESDAVCLSCSCASGRVLVVKARVGDGQRLVSDYGFRWVSHSAAWMELAPVQCGGNPWDETAPDGEVGAVRDWADTAGARLGNVGFVYATEPQAICRACQCARGDQLMVTPGGGTSASDVYALGFGPIY